MEHLTFKQLVDQYCHNADKVHYQVHLWLDGYVSRFSVVEMLRENCFDSRAMHLLNNKMKRISK